jgi:hypothetical protein
MTHPLPPEPSPECDALDAALADYLEHTLDADAVATIDTHRATCARCDALVRDLQAIQAEAAELRAFAPSRNLWPGIAASISAPVLTLRRDRPRTWLPAASIAAALVFVTAGTTYVVARMTAHTPAPATQQVAANAGTTTPATATPQAPAGTNANANASQSSAAAAGAGGTVTPVAHKQSTEATYAQEIAGLHAIVEQRRSQLDPRTRAVIEHNLQVIDTAIAESRRALASDPHSAFLSDQLDQALDTKLELLRTVALLPART